jgi:hypothetical protein
VVGTDCQSGMCAAGVCVQPATCTNRVRAEGSCGMGKEDLTCRSGALLNRSHSVGSNQVVVPTLLCYTGTPHAVYADQACHCHCCRGFLKAAPPLFLSGVCAAWCCCRYGMVQRRAW